MSKKKICAVIVCLLMMVVLNIYLIEEVNLGFSDNDTLEVELTIKAEYSEDYNMYFSDDGEFSEDSTDVSAYNKEEGIVKFNISPKRYLRIDFGNKGGNIQIDSFKVRYQTDEENVLNCIDTVSDILASDSITYMTYDGARLSMTAIEGDPYIILDDDKLGFFSNLDNRLHSKSRTLAIALCVIVDIFVLIGIRYLNKILALPLELFRNRKLIVNLSKNDFKTKFAGSYLGIVWAFVQPIVTVLVYWFVFEVGLKAGRTSDFPFILWLMAGLVPWFFFSEALMGGTNALMEYNYLVKKVVFKISILPIVKTISSIFVHLFFVLFVILMCWIYGYHPDLYSLQIIYYICCSFILVLGLSYLTSAVVCFFKDLTQIINIILQVGVWMTPIMWDSAILSPTLQIIFRLNPMYYVVDGFRDALLGKVWFWDKPVWTVYFWLIVTALFVLGTTVFKKLKVHFADVL